MDHPRSGFEVAGVVVPLRQASGDVETFLTSDQVRELTRRIHLTMP
jgi:hypothetical protein